MSTTTDLDRSSVPRYVQLAGLFRRNIETGEWRLGEQIPVIDKLIEEFGVARATIRQALGVLETEGLIDRKRAKGTFVLRSPKERIWCEVQTDWAGFLRAREGAQIEVLHVDNSVRAPALIDPIGTFANSYKHLRRRHSRNGQAYLLADIYIAQSVAKRISKADFKSKYALRLISDIPGVEVADARQVLTISTADLELARYLAIPLNAPIAFVQRVAMDAKGEILLIANGHYRGDLVRLDLRLK